MTGNLFAYAHLDVIVRRLPRPALILILILGMSTVTLVSNRPVTQPASTGVPPAASPPTNTSAYGFLPVLRRASAQADVLVALGEARERNLLRIRSEQSAMDAALGDADAWLVANPAWDDDPAMAAYHVGAEQIRTAIEEAQAGFLRLDFERVAAANARLKEGAQSLHQAIDLLALP